MSEKLFNAMSNEVKQWYCIISVEGEMFSIQEVVDLLNELVTKCHKLEKENKGLENEHERQNNEIKLLRQEHRRLRNQVREWEKIYCYTKKFYSINDLDINLIKDNDYITPSVIEITFGEIINENKRLKKDMENKKELISNLESKVIRQKGQLRNLNKSKFKIILDFCNWLREQGAEYETINYGDDADIAEMINEYLKEEGD